MNRKYLSTICLLFFCLNSSNAFCYTVHDPANYKRAFEILKAARDQIKELQEMKGEAQRTRQQIGDLKDKIQNAKDDFKNWETYYDKIDTLDTGDFSVLDLLGINRYTSSKNPIESFKLIDEKLFRSQPKPANAQEQSEGSQQMIYEREKIARHSLVTGIVVAEKSKNDLKNSKEKIKAVSSRALNSEDMVSLIRTQNEMLGLIASELVMQRELQAQMLEFMTAHASNQYGTGQNLSPKKIEFKSRF